MYTYKCALCFKSKQFKTKGRHYCQCWRGGTRMDLWSPQMEDALRSLIAGIITTTPKAKP